MQRKYFLKLAGVSGESKSPRHFGEIEVSSFSWGEKNPQGLIAGSGGGRGKAQINDLTINKKGDKTSQILAVACHTGQLFSEGLLTVEEFAEWGSLIRSTIFKMTSILLDSVTSDHREETVEMNFERLEVTRS